MASENKEKNIDLIKGRVREITKEREQKLKEEKYKWRKNRER